MGFEPSLYLTVTHKQVLKSVLADLSHNKILMGKKESGQPGSWPQLPKLFSVV